MKIGEVLNGYTILQDFTTAGGGLSKWSFASRKETEYFIKEFLAPTFPLESSPGGERTKQQKRHRCEEFEAHHRLLMQKLSSRASEGGNLIVTIDFFRHGAKYYKITEKVDVKGLSIADIAKLNWQKKRLILLTAAHSLRILHQAAVVHGDLKPDNMLIKESEKGGYVAKLIDFDDSYVAGRPPLVAEETVGDPVYYSPELLRYITHNEKVGGSTLGLKSDVFSLGLIYTQFLTGRLPGFDRRKYRYPCEVVNSGARLDTDEITIQMRDLIIRMLSESPTERPDINEVFTTLKSAAAPKETLVTPVLSRPILSGSLLKATKPGRHGSAVDKTVRAGTVLSPMSAGKELRGSLAEKACVPAETAHNTKLTGTLVRGKE